MQFARPGAAPACWGRYRWDLVHYRRKQDSGVLPTTGLSALLELRPAVFLACTMDDRIPQPQGSARSAAMASDGASRRAAGHLQLRKRRPAGMAVAISGLAGAYVALGAGVLA